MLSSVERRPAHIVLRNGKTLGIDHPAERRADRCGPVAERIVGGNIVRADSRLGRIAAFVGNVTGDKFV